MIKKIGLFLFLSAFCAAGTAIAQTRASADSLCSSYNAIVEGMSGHLSVPDSLEASMQKHIMDNTRRKNLFFRIRIFFDNSRDARTVSSKMAEEFSSLYPDVPVYNQYANPYFKVTVGDFRSKSDAMKFMEEMKKHYPSAFLVKESGSAI